MRHVGLVGLWAACVWALGGDSVAWGEAALTAELRDFHGAPTIFINDAAQPPLFFCADPNPDPEHPFKAQAHMAREAGVRFFTFGLPMPWPQPGAEADFTPVDQAIQDLLDIAPDALLMPRFSITPPPHWWLDAHPGNEMLFSDSAENPDHVRWGSVASQAWRDEFPIHLARFVAHLEARWGDHIIGYHPCNLSTAEWFYKRAWEPVHGGFEEPMRLGFIQWLRAEYGDDIEALRAAWGQPTLEWATIQVPTADDREQATHGLFRDPIQDRYVIDFATYQQIAVVEPMEQAAALIKELTDRKKLVAYFYGYFFELGNLPKGASVSGHLALDRLLRSPDVDILTSPLSYLDRGPGGMNAFMLPVDSVTAAGKLFITEDDTRTMYTDRSTLLGRITGTNTLEETHWEHRRHFGRLLPRRMGTWYMDLIAEGWLNDPGIWEDIARNWASYEAEMETPKRFAPEVAIVVDERSVLGAYPDRALHAPLFSFFREEWCRMGADVRMHLLSDVLEARIALPAVTLFLGCWWINDAERDALHAALEGKTAVWFYGSGFLSDEAASAAQITALTGFSMTETEGGVAAFRFRDEQPLTRKLDGTSHGNPNMRLRPRWSVDQAAGVEVLARYADDDSVAIAAKDLGDWRSLYVGGLGVPAQFLRNILQQAGAHVYLDSDDIVATDGRFLTVSASSAGEKILHLPPNTRIERLDVADAELNIQGDRLIETFELGETRQYRLSQE